MREGYFGYLFLSRVEFDKVVLMDMVKGIWFR